MRRIFLSTLVSMLATAATPAVAAESALSADRLAFRDLFKELVETDTSITTGDCTALSAKIAARLKQAGFRDEEITQFSVAQHPKEGGIVAILPGTSARAKPILLMGHIDVVTAKREDWTRDPYTLVEENGYFYGRGTRDMKAMDAIWIDMLMRFRKEGFRPARTIKMALTCGEETSQAFNGARWLAENRKDLIDAEFALNEGGGGRTDGRGNLVQMRIHVGEKTAVNYRLEATNPGGHSSMPVPENAIYDLAEGLIKVRNHQFPVMLNDTTRNFFAKLGAAGNDEKSKAMLAIVANPQDKAAEAILSRDAVYNAYLHTTCVATLLDAGHAENALPQRAGANINCRLFPGVSAETVRQALEQAIGNPSLSIRRAGQQWAGKPAPPPLNPAIIGPMERLAAKYYPGVPVLPSMSTGATDGIYFQAVGIPTYGPPVLYNDPDGNGVHGLNERIAVDAVYQGREYLTELVRLYASR